MGRSPHRIQDYTLSQPGVMFYLVLCMSVIAVHLVTSTEHGLAKFVTPDLGTLPMDIALKNHSMLTIPGLHSSSTMCSIRTVNFHDFDMGLVALKAVDEGKCFIKPTSETYEEVMKLLEEFKHGRTEPVKQSLEGWKVAAEPLPDDLVKSTVGGNIAEFCTDYKVYLLQDQKILKSLKDLPKRSESEGAKKLCVFNCGTCSGVLMDETK